tara:strand:+ start:740 stop:1201 length:462 start_codon:yes stop_codon:yes gene_type:complete
MKKSENTYRRIIEQVELGTTLTQVCRAKDMPGLTTVHTWMKQDQKFKEQLLEARRVGAMVWLDKMQDMLDQDTEPTKVQLLRERLFHARWMASKLISVFGDKQTVENVGDPLIKIVWDDGSSEDKQSGSAHTIRSSNNNKQPTDKITDKNTIN